jgi:hypothetical protein
MTGQRSTRESRDYPHGSGDRNTMPSSDVDDTELHEGGTQRTQAGDPAAPGGRGREGGGG